MDILREMSDKKLMLETLRIALGRGLGKVIVSTPPPFFEKELQRYTHPWLRILLSRSKDYHLGYYNDGLKEICITHDTMVVALPGAVLISKGDKPGAGVQVIFRDHFTRYLYYENGDTQWRHTSNPVSPSGRHIIQSLCEMPLSEEYDAAREKIITALLHIALIELNNDNSLIKGKSYNTYFTALEYISINFHLDIDRRAAAKACGVTTSHLSRLFIRFGNEDFKDTLKKIRMRRAEPLLMESSLTIDEIALLCGFKSATHFIRIFRNFNGCSPGRFRGSAKSGMKEMKKDTL